MLINIEKQSKCYTKVKIMFVIIITVILNYYRANSSISKEIYHHFYNYYS